jgi:hypothetical protein
VKTELLGRVRLPSRTAVILDPGLLHLWSHRATPVMPDWAADEETLSRAHGWVDFALEGRDAEAAGTALGLQHPLFLHDLSLRRAGQLRRELEAITTEHKWEARLQPLVERAPHRERIAQAVAFRGGSGFHFHGVPGVAIGGLPEGELLIFGRRMEDVPGERWREISLEVKSDAVVASTRALGKVGVDCAQLLIADADALAGWQHRESSDGKADFAFWGRDAKSVAASLGAGRLGDQEYGWTYLDVGQASERAAAVEGLKTRRQLQLETDLRLHSDPFLLEATLRASPTESATRPLGESLACGFTTSWGDGEFATRAEYDAGGALVRVAIELGTEERAALVRSLRSARAP